MACIYKPFKLITQRYQYLLITSCPHPNKCSSVKKKKPIRAHPRIWWATSPLQKQPQKTTKNHNGNNPKPQKEQKTDKKIDFFLTVSSCAVIKKQPWRDSRLSMASEMLIFGHLNMTPLEAKSYTDKNQSHRIKSERIDNHSTRHLIIFSSIKLKL